jgi:glycosyltransferase involved in cell wall biosynthesis
MGIRITFIITDLETGGAEMMLYKLLSKIDRNLFSPTVVSLISGGPLASKIADLEIPVQYLGMKRSLPDPFAIIRLGRILRKNRPDIIQTWMYHSDLLGGVAGRIFSRKPVVWNVRNSDLNSDGSKKLTIITARICSYLSSFVPKKIICCGEKSRDVHISLGYEKNRFEVIGNGFNLENFHPCPSNKISVCQEFGLNVDSYIIGLVGRFSAQKDHGNFIEAASIIKKQIPESVFILCGDGITTENERLFDQINKYGLGNSVHLLGRRTDIPRLTNAFDVACSSSSFGEAFSNTLGEAMACGIPVVATDVGDSAGVVGNCGTIVPPGNPEAFALALIDMFAIGANERKKLGEMGRIRTEENFSLEKIVEKYETLYSGIYANTSN